MTNTIRFWLPAALMAVLLPWRLDAVEIQNGIFKASTAEMTITFQGLNVASLTNLLTQERLITSPGQGWLQLNMQGTASTPLQTGSWQIVNDPQTGTQVGTISASDGVHTVTVLVGEDQATQEIFVRVQGTSTQQGVQSVIWGIQGFDPALGKLVLPAEAGITFDASAQPSVVVEQYPTHWEAQFAIYEAAAGSFMVYAPESNPHFKRLWASRQFGTLDLGLEVFARAPYSSATAVPLVEWRLKSFAGNWKPAADYYRNWSSSQWPVRSFDSRREWTKQIRGVVTIINPDPSYLNPLAARLDPTKTLLYLINWRQDTYDVNYPDYTPGPNTAAFVKQAQAMGFRIMLHANALGVATYNPAYQTVSQYQIRDPDSGNPIFWPTGLWPGVEPPPGFLPSFAFISPCAPEFRALIREALRPAIDALQPDAIHLDAGGVLLNDANGLLNGETTIQGMIDYSREPQRCISATGSELREHDGVPDGILHLRATVGGRSPRASSPHLFVWRSSHVLRFPRPRFPRRSALHQLYKTLRAAGHHAHH